MKRGRLTRGLICQIAEKSTEKESSTTQVEGGDSLVDIDTSVLYDDWLVKEGLAMDITEEEHTIEIKVEDITDSGGEMVQSDGEGDNVKKVANTENQDNQVESGEIEKEEIPHKSDDNEVSFKKNWMT